MLCAVYTGAPGFHTLDLEPHFDAVVVAAMAKISQAGCLLKVVGGLWFRRLGFSLEGMHGPSLIHSQRRPLNPFFITCK